MSDTLTKDQVIQQIWERAKADEDSPINEDNVRRIVDDVVQTLIEDKDGVFARKFSPGQPEHVEHKLLGSKFARWKLSLQDIEFLHDLQTALRQHNPAKFRGPSNELDNAFQAISQAYYVPEDKVKDLDRRALDNEFPRIPLSAFYGKDKELAARGAWQETEAYQRAIRAMDTAESGYGSQLIGAQYVGDLWDGAQSDSRVFALLDTFEMTAPTAYLPVAADLPEMLFVSENTANNSSNYTTSKTGSNRVQVDAKKFVIHQMWSGEMEEDSIVPFVPFLRAQAQRSIAHYSDSIVLNGDTTNAATGNINLDDADPADTKHYLAFDGIRHAGLVDNTNNGSSLGGAITTAALIASKGRMIDTTYQLDWGHPSMPSDLIYAADPQSADKIGSLDDVLNWKIQQRRELLLTGQVAEVLGHPVIGTIAVSKTEADGKVSTTAGNNTLGQVVAFNKNGFVVGWRRRVKTMVEPLPATDQMRIVYSLRIGFGRFSPTGAASGIEAADVIYNIDLS